MAQIQVLPSVPSFGSRLAQVLGQAGVDIGQGFAERRNKQQIANLTQELGDPSKSPIEKLGIITKLTGRLRPDQTKALEPYFASMAFGEPIAQPATGTPQQFPEQPGVPMGPSAPITAETQPTGVQNAPAPTGQTRSDIEKRKAFLRNMLTFPALKDRAQQELKEITDREKLQAKEQIAERSEERATARKEEEKLDELQSNILKGHESAQVSKANLNRMEALIKSPNMITPLGAYLSDLFGVPVSLAAGADAEEFEKLAAQRGLQVGSAYGFGRILDKEFANFLKTIPRLTNTEEGKERIIRTLRYFDNLAEARYNQYKNILGEREPGERTRSFELKLNEAMQPFYDKFGEVLKYGDELVELKNEKGEKGKVRKSQVEEALKEGYSYVEG